MNYFTERLSPASKSFHGRIGLAFCLALAVQAGAIHAASPISTDFEHGATAWREPGDASGIVAEPGKPGNHVYQIVAARPHHIQLALRGSEDVPDFIASLRFKILSHEGEPPMVYVYGRLAGGGFRAVSVGQATARAFCYFGQNSPAIQLGTTSVATRGAWVRAKLACYEDQMFVKVWPEGAAEPGWQMSGADEGHAKGSFAVGVWTSPRTPSKASVLFDDIAFQPIRQGDLAGLGIRFVSHAPLDATTLKIQGRRFETATDIGLATGSTLVAFDRQTGILTHIVHRPTGQDFVGRQSSRPLFSLSLTKPYAGKGMESTAADFRTVHVAATGDGKLEWTFKDHASLPITAWVTATAGDDGLVSLRIRVTNPSDWAVARIEFPRFTAPAVLGRDAGDDRLLAPWTDGTVYEAPGEYSQSHDAAYPGGAMAQFMAFYDRSAGLYLATRDADGHAKSFGLRSAKGRSIEVPLIHLVPEVAGREVALPYDTVLGTFVGDWRDAAAIYKGWAQKQPWCAKTLAQRDDIPAFLKEGSGVIVGGIQNAKGYNGFLGDDLAGLPSLLAAYRQRTGLAHIVFVPYGWEGRGTWAGIHYFPAVPSNEAWQKANAALLAQGDRTAMLTSGFWWVVKRQAGGGGPAFDDTQDFQRRQEMVIRNADGKPWQFDNYDNKNAFAGWRGLSVKLCHGSQAARETMLRIFLDAARLGTPLVSFDQEIGGGQNAPCYSKTHGHPPGYGNWMWTDFRDLCAEILRQGKPIQPELGLLMENTSELAIPYMATYWSRQFGEIDHGGVGARGVGLFSYLYHEYVTAIGAACVQGQGAQGTQPSAELRDFVLANNLTRGLIPGPFIQDVPLEAKDPWHAKVSQAFFAFARPYKSFPEYLLLGVACRPPEVRSREQEVWFYRQDPRGELTKGGKKVSRLTARLPAVTAGSFLAADGSLGTILVNATAEPQQAVVGLPTDGNTAVLYRADRTEERRYEACPAEIAVSLEPFGTRMLVIRKIGFGRDHPE